MHEAYDKIIILFQIILYLKIKRKGLVENGLLRYHH